jgi:hypothetical protein
MDDDILDRAHGLLLRQRKRAYQRLCRFQTPLLPRHEETGCVRMMPCQTELLISSQVCRCWVHAEGLYNTFPLIWLIHLQRCIQITA